MKWPPISLWGMKDNKLIDPSTPGADLVVICGYYCIYDIKSRKFVVGINGSKWVDGDINWIPSIHERLKRGTVPIRRNPVAILLEDIPFQQLKKISV